MSKLTGAALDRAVANALGLKSVNNCEKWGKNMTEEDDDIRDYKKPCMDAEQALKDAHNAVLEGKLDLTMTKAMDAVISARLMYGALRLMKEKQA